jgi:hypothetical protein
MSLPRDFKGIWIPKELWTDHRLTYFEKMMVAEIDSLDGADHCYADNEHFQVMFNAKERTVSQAITKLKRIGLVEQIKFDGRTRTLKSNLKTYYTLFYGSESQKENDKHYFTGQTSRNPLPDSIGTFIEQEIPSEIPEEKKVYKEKLPRSARQPAAAPIILNKETRKFEGISEEDLKGWQEAFPAVNIRKEIVECQIWAASTPRNNYRKSLNKWMSNVNKNHTTPYEKKEEPKQGTEKDKLFNKNLAEKWEREFSGKGANHYAILATPSKVTFVMPNDDGYSVDYDLSIEDFDKMCRKGLLKMKI